MRKTIKRFFLNIQREMLKTDMERYLEGSRDAADLEYRTKQWMMRKPFIQTRDSRYM